MEVNSVVYAYDQEPDSCMPKQVLGKQFRIFRPDCYQLELEE